ncbi:MULTISPECIES: hypothetical protein [unclassified Mycolicibacterium]|uniref:hypothetical protein n=1 Tax=unclassified Mycolicibacterium TaxID=2636767 RepID=UPI0012DCFE96|nr:MULTISPECIES: hypothetical protein [unclassified Mycolicibacterium]MUL85641.1 hypothetical protein [Mycolicibacterium sp. CBMA 329]MUL91518.1 hypothetical protein [Mycolicibacterium sp. CBMA 331]MUM02242.1 hypothetical protein [Mycolicibacterium sp. CBMA 334]MUM27301.1 hypothetical protein [Mycolicibacterium sp. CBMA 295]MUM41192.1 hypothetical protein [Mycolicibacterium sp. CBMA 247]
MPSAHACTVLGRRTCALLAAGSALLHVVMLTVAANAVAGAVLAVMIVGCLYCAAHLWQRGTSGVWCAVALMSLAMVALHTPMPAHHHGAGVASAPASVMTSVMALAVVLALSEATISAAVLYYRTRHRSVI